MSRAVDMSRAAIEARLQCVARLSTLAFSQPPRVDMSPVQVELRLRECAEMSAICLDLAASR